MTLPKGALWHPKKAKSLFDRDIRTALEDMTGTVKTNVFFRTPVATGALRASEQSSVKSRTGRVYFVAPGSAYATYANTGRRPGKQPPLAPIMRWLRSSRQGQGVLSAISQNIRSRNKLRSAAFIIARKIGRKGTKGSKFWDIAMRESKNPVRAIALKLHKKIGKGLQ